MEFVSILRELWRRKRLLVPAVILAALVAISSSYKLPSLEKRGLQLGAASSQILIDSPASTLVGGADANQLSTLATRARVYAQYLSSLEARDDISRASGIPARAISLSGPFSTDVGRNNYQAQPSAARANDILKEGQGYRLIFDAQDGVPIITVSAQAPDALSAIKLARASFVALKQYIRRLQLQADKVPVKPLPKGATAAPITPDAGVTVRELGAPVGGTIGGGNGIMLMGLVFIAVLGLACAAITILPGMARHWRLLERAEQLMDDQIEGRPLPPVAGAVDDSGRFGERSRHRDPAGDFTREADEAGAKRAASGWR
jgi:hypothetical protein